MLLCDNCVVYFLATCEWTECVQRNYIPPRLKRDHLLWFDDN